MTLAGGNLHAGPPLDGLNIWPVISTGAASPHRELLHNYDTSLKPVAGFRGALRRGDLKLIVRVRPQGCDRESQLPATILCGQVNNASLYNISADPSETTDLSAELSDQAQQMRERLQTLGKEAVPCWGGTGSVPNPPGFRGDCDAHPPKLNCTNPRPAVFEPGWCTAPGPAPTPAPAPAPAQPLLKCDKKLGSFCEHSGRACDASPTDPDHVLHTGNEALGACERLCEANAACNCISYAHDAPRAKTKCKLFRGVVGLKQEKSRDAYVPGRASNEG